MSVSALGTRLAAASLFLLAMNVTVAAPTPGDTDLIRERQDRLLEEQRRRLEELKDLPGKSAVPQAPSAPTDSRCFPIKTIELKGADALSERERQRLLKPYINQCLGVPQLNQLLKAITDHYLEKGLVTSRAYLPQQDLSSGHLQVLVVEGRLEGLKGEEGSGLSERELAMSFPGKPGELLDLREIEQMVDQLNRLPSNHVAMELHRYQTSRSAERHSDHRCNGQGRAGTGLDERGPSAWRHRLAPGKGNPRQLQI